MKKIIFLTALLTAIVGCSSLAPVKSAPPYKQIEVDSPFTWGKDNIMTISIDFPKGTYFPTYENESGYYYAAPEKLVGRDAGITSSFEGGIYFEKGRETPNKIYFIKNNLGWAVKKDLDENVKFRLVK